MKRILSVFFVTVLSFSLVACGGETTTTNDKETKQPEVACDRNDLNSILTAMETECETAIKSITDESVIVFEKIGETYESYSDNKEVVTEFYTESFDRAKELYNTLESISVDYFKCVASNGIKDYDVWDGSMEDFYDTWDDGMEDFYDAWDEIYEDLYDKTDELIENGEDNLSYGEYFDVWSDMYNEYFDSWSAMYDEYSDAWSKTYHNYSNVWSGFYNDNTNVEELLKKAAEEKTETKPEDTTSKEEIIVEEENESDTTELVDGMRPEFKEAMDSYEAFYDEYCDFMVKYKANPTDTKLITEYADMMKKVVDMDEKFKAWESNDLNNEELKYYIEVSSRIVQKMLEVAS